MSTYMSYLIMAVTSGIQGTEKIPLWVQTVAREERSVVCWPILCYLAQIIVIAALSLCHSQLTTERSETAKGGDDPDPVPASYENLGKDRALPITQCPS